jgi:hypothetical protein
MRGRQIKEIKKIHVLGLALVAVFAFSAVTAISASALEWLVKNETVTAALEVKTIGLLNLIHLSEAFLKPEVVFHCEGIFDGMVEAAAKA